MKTLPTGLNRKKTLRGLAAAASAALVIFLTWHPAVAFVTFESAHVRPVALSPDGQRLFAVNTPDNRLEIFDVTDTGLQAAGSVVVGLEPVAVAVRDAGEVWVVNHLSDSVSIVDVSSAGPRVIRTLLVGDEPRDIVFAGPGRQRAFITAAHRGQNAPFDPQLTTPSIGRADVWVFDAEQVDSSLGGTPLTIVTLFGDTPRALAATPDGSTVMAAVFHSGNQTTTVSEGAVCNGGEQAPPCKVRNVEMPGGLPGPETNVDGVERPETGLIVRFNETTQAWEDELARNWNPGVRFRLPDKDVFAIDATANPPVETASFAHVGTILFDVAVNPVSGVVYVANGEARNEVRFEGPGIFGGSTVRGHLQEARISIIDPSQGIVTPRHINKHIDYAVVPSPPGVKERSLATPVGMAVSSDGTMLYVAAFGSSAIGVFDTAALADDSFVPNAASHIAVSGGGPSGLVLDEERMRLYVFTRFDNGLSVVDTAERQEIAHLSLHNPEPPAVINGRRFLYDARYTSSNGEASCAGCHIFGDLDSLAWDLSDPDGAVIANPNPNRFVVDAAPILHPMKGPMTTQTLRGLFGNGPMHWRGDRTGGNDPGGDPLAESVAFMKFNVAFEGLLGRGAPLSEAEMQSFTDFILEVTMPPNPIRALDNSLTPAQAAGRDFYFTVETAAEAKCVTCHALDPDQGHFGTDGFSADVPNFEVGNMTLKIPQLRNMYQKVGMFGMPGVPFTYAGDNGEMGDQIRGFGFLHDGSEDTVLRHLRLGGNRLLRAEFAFPGGDEQRRQVEQFVLAFDSNLAPIVGQQVTLSGSNAAAVAPRIDLLMARAAAGECALTVKGRVQGIARGWYLDRHSEQSPATFVSDRRHDPVLADAQLRSIAAVPGQELTYTCVPPGEGLRIGIDRDADGSYDRDEIERGSDPADPAVTAPQCGGDCNDDYRVTVDELARGLRIALGSPSIELCPLLDINGDDAITVDELVAAVQNGIQGCRPLAAS